LQALQEVLAGTRQAPSGDRLHATRLIHPLGAGSQFTFQVTYTNLTGDELALLVYALELEPNPDLRENGFSFHKGVYHKLGYGKPAGLGSAAILIEKWEMLDPQARYRDPEQTGWTETPAGELRARVAQTKEDFYRSQGVEEAGVSPTGARLRQWPTHLFDLRRILGYPNDIRSLRYPVLQANEFELDLPLPGKEPKRQP
jgi:hypothetical protein